MSNSVAQSHKVVYKSEGNKDLFVFVQDVELYKKWKKGDKSIPLIQFLDSYHIFDTDNGSHTGIANNASKATLSNILDTDKEEEAVKAILEKGELVGPGSGSVEKVFVK